MAAATVLASSIAIVIGPTPPGTGVIAPATSLTGSKSTSPTRPSSVRLVPTSITVAPGLTISAPTIRGEPTAATRMSAREQTAARSRVREWQTVTVAFSPSSSAASGRPTRIERPRTTASAPSSSVPAWRSSSTTPRGVHGTRPGRPWASSPALVAVRPSTSLAGLDRRRSRRPGRPVRAAAAGRGSRRRSRRRSSSSTSSSSSPGRRRRAELVVDRADPDLLVRLALVGHVDVRGRVLADQHRGEAGHVAVARRDESSHVRGDPLPDLGRDRLAVDDPRAHDSSARPTTSTAQATFFSGA